MDKDIIVFAEEILGLDISGIDFGVSQPRRLTPTRMPAKFFVTKQQKKFMDLNLRVTESAKQLSREYSGVIESMSERFLRRFHTSNRYLTKKELVNKYRTSEYLLTMELTNHRNPQESFYTLRITKFNIILDEMRFTINTKYGGI